MRTARPHRLSAARLTDLLALDPADTRRHVRALRRLVLTAAPKAAESLKFGCLCYYHPRARFGAIGGNICMIEIHRGPVAPARHVVLSFIHGVDLLDPQALLRGRAKAKRFVPIEGFNRVTDARLARLVRAAWRGACGRIAEDRRSRRQRTSAV